MNTIICSKCGYSNPPGVRYCGNCGNPLFKSSKSKPLTLLGISALVVSLLLCLVLIYVWTAGIIPQNIFDPVLGLIQPKVSPIVDQEEIIVDDSSSGEPKEEEKGSAEEVAVTNTQTPLPKPSKTSTPTPISSDTPTETATATLTETPTPDDKVNCPAVSGPFSSIWNDQSDIGCATSQVYSGLVAEEHFEGGRMLWREPKDDGQALVLLNNGTWHIYKHAPFVEGSPEFPCTDENTPAQCPPTPKRGFGSMWCDIVDIRQGLGNATDCERGFQGTMQDFDKGHMLRTDRNAVFILYKDGTWSQK